LKEDAVTGRRFDDRGRLIIPEPTGPGRELREGEELTVREAYCSQGHNVVDERYTVGGRPGIKVAFRDPRGAEGLVVLSPVLGRLDKLVLKGRLIGGEKLELRCPECGQLLPVLTSCTCTSGGIINVLFLRPDCDINNSIGICNVVGCPNSSFVRSGEVIRSARLESW
jgi:hypothetical protein